MKKPLLLFSILILHLSFCHAQDTVAKVKMRPYLLVSGGASVPLLNSGYGGNSYFVDEFGYGYSGYAYNGEILSATAGLDIYHGWELTGTFSYIHNEFNASGVMEETAVLFINLYPSAIDLINIKAIRNYFYTNYACLLGITKSWKFNRVGIGFSLTPGEFISTLPALSGTGQNITYDSKGNPSYANSTFYMSPETEKNFVTDMGMHLDYNLTHHFFIRGQLDLMISEITHSGNYQVSVGNTDYSGYYTGFSYRNTNLFVGLGNATLGIGCKF